MENKEISIKRIAYDIKEQIKYCRERKQDYLNYAKDELKDAKFPACCALISGALAAGNSMHGDLVNIIEVIGFGAVSLIAGALAIGNVQEYFGWKAMAKGEDNRIKEASKSFSCLEEQVKHYKGENFKFD